MIAATGLLLTAVAGSAQEPDPLSETYGAWTVQCKSTASPEGNVTKRNCQVSQELRQKDTETRVITVVFTTSPNKVTLLTPFGLQLREGVELSADSGKLPTASFTTCLPSLGCIADLAIDAAEIENLQSSQTLTVLMTSVNGQKLQMNLSLDGFKGAVKRLQALQ